MDFVARNTFTIEIIQEIDKVKGRFKTYEDIREYVNEKYQTSFDYNQIVYQVNKLLRKNFGIPTEDANLFITELEKDVKSNGGFYEIELSDCNKLQKVVYVSSTMLLYAQSFLDIILVDATYCRNRFNLPLVNLCGISNYGKTIMLGFALMNNENCEIL